MGVLVNEKVGRGGCGDGLWWVWRWVVVGVQVGCGGYGGLS